FASQRCPEPHRRTKASSAITASPGMRDQLRAAHLGPWRPKVKFLRGYSGRPRAIEEAGALRLLFASLTSVQASHPWPLRSSADGTAESRTAAETTLASASAVLKCASGTHLLSPAVRLVRRAVSEAPWVFADTWIFWAFFPPWLMTST